MDSSSTFLPSEVLHLIFSGLDSNSALSATALCCRRFYHVAKPLLYSHIRLLHNEDSEACTLLPQLRPLTRQILSHQELAGMVRHLTLRGGPCDGYESEYLFEHGKRDEIQTVKVDEFFEPVVKEYSDSKEEEQDWLMHLSWIDHTDALLGVLLGSLPSLEKLDILFMFRNEHIETVLRKLMLGKPPASLGKLRDFMHTWDDPKYGMDPCWIGWCLQHSSIRRIFGHRIGSDDDELSDEWLNIEPGSSSVEHLELIDCKLSPIDTNAILRAPKALKVLIHGFGGGHLSYCDDSFNDFREALNAQEETLEDLSLSYEPRYGAFSLPIDDADVFKPMASFASFKSLKRLKIASIFLFGPCANEKSEDEAGGEHHGVEEKGYQDTPECDSRGNHEKIPSAQHDVNGTPYDFDLSRAVRDRSKSILNSDSKSNVSLHPFDFGRYRRLTDLFPSSLESLHILQGEDNFTHLLRATEDLLQARQLSISDHSLETPTLLPYLTSLTLSGPFLAHLTDHSYFIAPLYRLALEQGIIFRTLESRMMYKLEEMSTDSTSSTGMYHRSVHRGWGMQEEIEWAEAGHWGIRLPPEVEVVLPLTAEATAYWAGEIKVQKGEPKPAANESKGKLQRAIKEAAN